jgi:type II secretory pathway pseudopilin PulG
MNIKNRHHRADRSSQSGLTLIETLIATAVLLFGTLALMSVGMVAFTATENQGHLAARTAEYAQDKMEQLNSLAFCDMQTDTTQFPAASSGGTGINALSAKCPGSGPNATNGSSDPNNPATGYVDYLDPTGTPTTSSGNWYYIRVWKITALSDTLKQITVSSMVRRAVGGTGVGLTPQATVTSLKAYPF